MQTRFVRFLVVSALAVAGLTGCSDHQDESEANRQGVGAECAANNECQNGLVEREDVVDAVEQQQCLTEFSGGYCGIKNCQAHSDCPDGSLCVAHDNGSNYCFLMCIDKEDCNYHRSADNQANCVSSIVFVDDSVTSKACVPPSGS